METIKEKIESVAGSVRDSFNNMVEKVSPQDDSAGKETSHGSATSLSPPSQNTVEKETLALPSVDPPIARKDSLPPTPRENLVEEKDSLPPSQQSKEESSDLHDRLQKLHDKDSSSDSLVPPPMDPPLARRDSLPPTDEPDSIPEAGCDVSVRGYPSPQSGDLQAKQLPPHGGAIDVPPPIHIETVAPEVPPVVVQPPPPIEDEKKLGDYVPTPPSLIEEEKSGKKKTDEKAQGKRTDEKEGATAMPPPLRVEDCLDEVESSPDEPKKGPTEDSTQGESKTEHLKNKVLETIEKAKEAVGLGDVSTKSA